MAPYQMLCAHRYVFFQLVSGTSGPVQPRTSCLQLLTKIPHAPLAFGDHPQYLYTLGRAKYTTT